MIYKWPCIFIRLNNVLISASLAKCPEVVECHLISGGYDYLVKFVVKNINHYQEVIDDLLKKEKIVREYFSYIVIKTPVNIRGAILERIFSFEEK